MRLENPYKVEIKFNTQTTRDNDRRSRNRDVPVIRADDDLHALTPLSELALPSMNVNRDQLGSVKYMYMYMYMYMF